MSLDDYYRRCAIPKGPTRARMKRERRQTRSQVVKAARREVWRRSKGQCEFCGDSEWVTRRKLERLGSDRPWEHHLNEVFVTRAQGRGQPPEDIFNGYNCARCCCFCHDAFHAGELEVREKVRGKGCAGGLIVRPADGGPHAVPSTDLPPGATGSS